MDRFKETADAYNRLAESYEQKFMDLKLYDDTYSALCEQIPQSATVLEVGCGPGNITRYLIDKRPDISIDATDVAPNMVALAQKNNPKANCFLLDCRELDGIQNRYDAVVCGFCLPYLPNENIIRLIADTNRLLSAHGVFYISTVEGTDADSGYIWNSAKTEQLYMHYHSQEFLIEVLESSGFTIIERFRKKYSAGPHQSCHLIFIARKTS